MRDCYIYFFYDSDKNLLYIGKSTSLLNRLETHLSKDSAKQNPWKASIDKKNVVVYKCNNSTDLDLYETYFINKYKPLHNRDKVYGQVSSFEFPYLEPKILLQQEDGLLSLYFKATDEQKKALIKLIKYIPEVDTDYDGPKRNHCTDIDFGYYLIVKNKL